MILNAGDGSSTSLSGVLNASELSFGDNDDLTDKSIGSSPVMETGSFVTASGTHLLGLGLKLDDEEGRDAFELPGEGDGEAEQVEPATDFLRSLMMSESLSSTLSTSTKTLADGSSSSAASVIGGGEYCCCWASCCCSARAL